MAKAKTPPAADVSAASTAPEASPGSEVSAQELLREPAEVRHRDQLEALRQNEQGPTPASWRLSPRSVLTYITGSKKPLEATIDGQKVQVPITRKFFGDDSIVERAIVTLASERALLLVGEPGTGKSWLSEHLAAAISGCSTLTIQGTAGTTEDQVKYSWNIARVIAEGAKPENLVPSPTMLAMRDGHAPALRGDHPLRARRPGRAGLDPLRQGGGDPRAARRRTWCGRGPAST
jgi:hypothetical protein